MLQKTVKDIIKENIKLKDDVEFYKYISEKTLNINDRLIAEIAELEEEIALLKSEYERIKKTNTILYNDNTFLTGKYQKLINNIEELKNKYSGGF